ncbi:MAG: DUF364 domain-containing protein [Eubacteriales bacterium]|nr:DUF364 domain-containing protein [Eubacteriales bacterium]
MILERVYKLAKPRLEGRSIHDVRIGLGLMAVELDNELVGVTYVLSNEIERTCAALPQAGSLVGMKADEIALWAVEGKNVIRNALGLAVLNSVADFESLEQINSSQDADAVFSVDIRPEDTIGIIGHIGPVINKLAGRKNRILIFERDESKGTAETYPESAQSDLLPKCQVVFITSSTLINGTLDPLLKYCTNARDIVMVGSSTPLYPEAFTGTGVSVLSGTRWLSSNKDSILAGVSQYAGIKQLMKYGQKISVKVAK